MKNLSCCELYTECVCLTRVPWNFKWNSEVKDGHTDSQQLSQLYYSQQRSSGVRGNDTSPYLTLVRDAQLSPLRSPRGLSGLPLEPRRLPPWQRPLTPLHFKLKCLCYYRRRDQIRFSGLDIGEFPHPPPCLSLSISLSLGDMLRLGRLQF